MSTERRGKGKVCKKRVKHRNYLWHVWDSSDSDKDNIDNNESDPADCDNHNVEDIRNDVTP